MEFVSKDQTYEALRKLILENAARLGDKRLEDLARNMQREGDHSRDPELYKRFLDGLRSDPLEPQTALEAAAQFLEENVDPAGNADVARLLEQTKLTAEDPERGNLGLWNRWIGLLESV